MRKANRILLALENHEMIACQWESVRNVSVDDLAVALRISEKEE
jgi:hypothetical protein